MKINKKLAAFFLKDLSAVLVGSMIYAIGFRMFVEPARVIMGGATGVGTVLNLLFGFPVGAAVILVNVPLVALSILRWGFRSVRRTVPGIFLISLFIDLFAFVPPIATDTLISAVFGGAITGAGLGLMLWRGYTTGGSDLAASLLHDLVPPISLGIWVFVLDFAVIFAAAILLKNFESLFYSAVVSLVFSFVMDYVISGANRAKLAVIISPASSQIAANIAKELERGVTQLYGRGYFSAKEETVLLCAVKKTEIFRLKECVSRADKDAFVIIGNAEEILGLGFGDKEETGLDNRKEM